MAIVDYKIHEKKSDIFLRDIRPMSTRIYDWFKEGRNGGVVIGMCAAGIYYNPVATLGSDFIFLFCLLYFWMLTRLDRALPYKMPMGAPWADSNNKGPGRSGKAEGILYLGNIKKSSEEVWFTNPDARTHILYLGTTGAGKTEGLKSIVTNALTWGSGFVYVDGKADTDLWSSLSSLVRRFGRDDDLLILNYMTGNSDVKAPSNSMNPFSGGSASYLINMLTSLMPDAEGDNAMWKERAVSLLSSVMPALTWKRDHQEMPLSINTIRESMTLPSVVRLARDQAIPDEIRKGVRGYLDSLPGYVDAAFDDEGKDKPAGPDSPAIDTTTARQQHGYLTMQFTRSLQSLGDSYGYIFNTPAADVDMVDVVLNRRILVVLIPALEKSGDEIANLGKIVAATLKGMMGSTLGSTIEGDVETVIENKPTKSATPFITVFDEVGYYTAQGMAVMAAQARSLGFSLVFSGQDLPAMKKRVREEANSITANCNIKIFGKLEDPTETKEFFEKTVGMATVVTAGAYNWQGGGDFGSFMDSAEGKVESKARASYDDLKQFKEGEAVISFGDRVVGMEMFYSNPPMAKAMRVTRYVSLPPPDKNILAHAAKITRLRDLMVHKTWTARRSSKAQGEDAELEALISDMQLAQRVGGDPIDASIAGVIGVYNLSNPINLSAVEPVAVVAAPVAASAPSAAVAETVSSSSPPPASFAAGGAESPAQAGVAAAGGKKNPLGFFTKGGKSAAAAGAEASSAPLAASPVATSLPADAAAAASVTAESVPTESAPSTVPSAPREREKAVSWKDLVGAEQGSEDAGAQISPSSVLSAEVRGTLAEAGAQLRERLVKGKTGGDSSDAAE